MTTGAIAIDEQVLEVSRDTISRCVAIESESGLFGKKSVGMAGAGRNESKVVRNFFYLSLTRALSEGVEAAATADVRALESGIYFLYQHAMHVDGVVDRGAHALLAPGNAYLVLGLDQLRLGVAHEAKFAVLRTLVFDRLQATLEAVELERFAGEVPDLGYDGYAGIARRKCALAEVVPHVILAIDVAMDARRRDAQIRALGHVHVGMQWIDDLADLSQDRARRQPSLLWSRLTAWAERVGVDLVATDARRFRQLAYVSGLAAQSLKEAIAEFRAAQSCVGGFGMAMFHRTLESMIQAQERNRGLIEALIVDAARKSAA